MQISICPNSVPAHSSLLHNLWDTESQDLHVLVNVHREVQCAWKADLLLKHNSRGPLPHADVKALCIFAQHYKSQHSTTQSLIREEPEWGGKESPLHFLLSAEQQHVKRWNEVQFPFFPIGNGEFSSESPLTRFLSVYINIKFASNVPATISEVALMRVCDMHRMLTCNITFRNECQ